jgi:hypothetical protein
VQDESSELDLVGYCVTLVFAPSAPAQTPTVILAARSDLKLEIEGYTDNTGSEELNQALSERRAMAVRDFLVQQGVTVSSITVRGLGESEPVASNDTAVGRQLNRRVEMIVSGDIIGTVPSVPTSSLR